MSGIIHSRPPRKSRTPGSASTSEAARPRREKRGGLDLSRLLPFEPKPARSRHSDNPTPRRSASRTAPRRTFNSLNHQPPVLVRRGLQDMATPVRRGRLPRRRFDLTLNVPGAEVRLPSMPSIGLGWRFASALLVAWMLLAAYALVFSSAFQVEMLTVEGMQRLTLDDLSLALGITGESVVSLNPHEISQQLLEAFPDLASVEVNIGLPASVRLVVSERQPVVAWVRQGDTVWLDLEGVVFPPRGETPEGLMRVEADSLPLLSSVKPEGESVALFQPAERIDPQQVEVLLDMSRYMPAGAGMAFDAQRGFGWSDERGWNVYFGTRLDDIDQKLVIYQAIVDRLQAEGIQPALISVEFLHAPYYRMER